MSRYDNLGAKFSDLVGERLVSVEVLEKGSDKVKFKTESGKTFVMEHYQDCCESVSIEDVCGDVSDLIGAIVISAEEVEGETPNDYKFEYEPDSYTWTFYKIQTDKGSVEIRWLGESNGYYSEGVDFSLEK